MIARLRRVCASRPFCGNSRVNIGLCCVTQLIHKKTGFTTTQKNRVAYVIQLQHLLGAGANDLELGDAGTDPEGVVRKKRALGQRPKKRRKRLVNDLGDEWDEDEEFEAMILGRKVSAGVREDGHRKGTVLYHISWPGYSADAATWEPVENVGLALIEEWEASLEAEAELDAEEACELDGDD